MSIAGRPSTSALEARRARLEATLGRLVESAEAAGNAGRLDRWAQLRDRQRKVARELASVTASIAQAQHAQLVNRSLPRRRFSERVPR